MLNSLIAAGDESGEGASEIGCHSQSWGLGLLRHARCSRVRSVIIRLWRGEVGSLTLGSRVVLSVDRLSKKGLGGAAEFTARPALLSSRVTNSRTAVTERERFAG